MVMRIILFIVCGLFAIPGFTEVKVDMQNYKNFVILTGSVAVSDFTFSQACGNTNCSGGQHSRGPLTSISLVNGEGKSILVYYENSNYPICNRHYPHDKIDWTASEKNSFVQWANSYLAGSPVYQTTDFGLPPGGIPTEIQSYRLSAIYFRCKSPENGLALHVQLYSDAAEIINPPELIGACTLNSQNLNLNYSSSALNVNGLNQSTNLIVSCSSGTAKDYQLRLTGSNVINGRLNFGNGVSAIISLNGTQVEANGSGIQLRALTSSSIPVSATLVGTASSSGVTNANGVLVLDAL